jgi:hypothetical protein
MSTNNPIQFEQFVNKNFYKNLSNDSTIKIMNICQAELAHVLELRRQRDAIDERLKEAEQAIRSAMEAGASVQPGILSARLKVTERRNVAWKVVCERELGEDYCRRVLAATRPASYTSLVIGA